jgi:hypothetical protein
VEVPTVRRPKLSALSGTVRSDVTVEARLAKVVGRLATLGGPHA